MQGTLKVCNIGGHSKGVIFPKSFRTSVNDKIPYNLNHGKLTMDLREAIARKRAKFINDSFKNMKVVSEKQMERDFPGWGPTK